MRLYFQFLIQMEVPVGIFFRSRTLLRERRQFIIFFQYKLPCNFSECYYNEQTLTTRKIYGEVFIRLKAAAYNVFFHHFVQFTVKDDL